MPKKTALFCFDSTVKAIINTQSGQERNMYPYLRDLFIHVLKHPPDNIIVDSPQLHGRGAPDLAIRIGTGIKDAKDREITHDWVVMEAKSEAGLFSDIEKREKIFNEKSKYITIGTQWFLMIDPQQVIARPVAMGSQLHFDPQKDIIVKWQNLTQEKFRNDLNVLHADNATDSPALRAFRQGDESQIAIVKVDLPEAQKQQLSATEKERLQMGRRDFLNAVKESTKLLQNACRLALIGWEKEIGDLQRQLAEFDNDWEGYTLHLEPVTIKGKRINGKEAKQEHDQQARQLAKTLRKNMPLSKLVTRALPAYHDRTGKKKREPFAAESANLILARILLLRFFEDHNFFGNKKYVCNGGVATLQDAIAHHEYGYAVILEFAYKKGFTIYADAFDFTDLNWVLASTDKQVSQAIELTMMYLSFFDFSTISGDILTGIYDRFLDSKQRKAMGEFYTPPSIARYIVKRLEIQPDDSVFDPACGSGTFLLEAFAHMTGGDLSAGRALYSQTKKVLANIGGNDLNPFSATMSHIQMLWHLLPLKQQLKRDGFPDIRISGGKNAVIVRGELEQSGDIYETLDQPLHDFVIGNPPYVRPERRDTQADLYGQQFFAPIGGTKKDLYNLFIYKALSRWCRPHGSGQKAGRLGFVLPLSFCDNKSNEDLRRLFMLGGRFRILEIVDMEAVAPHVFDASVNPIILLAENKPAQTTDTITLRVASEACIMQETERGFDIEQAATADFRYEEVWRGGRILTKLTKQRQAVADKMAATPTTLADIARTFWVGRKGNKIKEWRNTKPNEMLSENVRGNLVWQEKQMLGRGAVFRRQLATAADNSGLDFYKGENIRACRLEGEAERKNILPDSISDPSFWKYRDILPSCGYAFLRIALGITAARFNPQEHAFLDTATLLFPTQQWESFPLDAALLSRLYQFYYAVHLREGAVQSSWSNLYPRNLRMIPLPNALQKSTEKLTALRAEFLCLCKTTQNRPIALSRALQEAGAISLQIACQNHNLTMDCAKSLQTGTAKIDAPASGSIVPQKENNRYVLRLNGNNWFVISGGDIASFAAAALTVFHQQEITRDAFYTMDIPRDAAALAKFTSAVAAYDSGGDSRQLEATLDKIDAIVGKAFGLSAAEIDFIQTQMREDDFLCRIRPNLPFSGRRQRGLAESLSRSDRYA